MKSDDSKQKRSSANNNEQKTIQILHVADEIPQGTMSWFSGMCLVIGLMIGSGIFSTPAKILQDVGTPSMAMLMWLIGGIVTFAGTFCYIELGCMLPKSGGEQAYLDVAFRKPRALISFLFCWAMILCVRPGAAAADSVIFAKYLMFPFIDPADQNAWVQRGVGILCITLITVLNGVSTRLAVKIHDYLTVIKVLVLSLISLMGVLVAMGIYTGCPKADNWGGGFTGISTNGASYASALFRIFWAYDGWNNLNYATGELKDPKKNLPKAASLGVSIVTILYCIANFSYFSVVPIDEILKSSELLAARYFIILFGEVFGQKILPIFIALSAYGAVCAMVFSASRVIYAAAKAKLLPFSGPLSTMNKRFQTPLNALVLNYVITVILIVGPPPGAAFEFLVEMVGYPTWLFYGISVIGLLTMRKSHAHLPRPIKAWYPIAILFILCSVFLSIFPFVPKESEEFPFYLPSLVGLLFTLSGVPFWWYLVKGKNVDLDFDGGH